MELELIKLDIELAASGGSGFQTLNPMAECLASPRRAFQCFGYYSRLAIYVSSGIGDFGLPLPLLPLPLLPLPLLPLPLLRLPLLPLPLTLNP